MIFITVGSQKFPFNRLFKYIDDLIEEDIINGKDVFAQIGTSTYKPINFSYTDFLDAESISEKYLDSEVVITHAGTASIISALNGKKKVIVVPRKYVNGEHVDNHQYEISKQFSEQGYCLECTNYESLKESIINISNKEFVEFKSNQYAFIKELKSILKKID